MLELKRTRVNFRQLMLMLQRSMWAASIFDRNETS